jgi:hypothetical protein
MHYRRFRYWSVTEYVPSSYRPDQLGLSCNVCSSSAADKLLVTEHCRCHATRMLESHVRLDAAHAVHATLNNQLQPQVDQSVW